MESRVSDKTVDVIMELLKLPEDQRDKLIELLRKYPPQKVIAAAKAVAQYSTKNMKLRTSMTVEEFEKIVRRMRW